MTAITLPSQAARRWFGLGTPIVVLSLLGLMVLPMPPVVLDLFFTFNIALSLVVILMTVYTQRPLEFSIFPSVLLIATLLRLSLNVASTRVVLLEGHTGTDAAGRVIEAFGQFVMGGDYAVGLAVFAILVIINFVVVTKGAGRVSEVSARFTLDAMPGKQMAIDADLNAGILSAEEAKLRRAEIAEEADFYGAMDGASKFVRGDAVAGILILFINIVGGLAVGEVHPARRRGVVDIRRGGACHELEVHPGRAVAVGPFNQDQGLFSFLNVVLVVGEPDRWIRRRLGGRTQTHGGVDQLQVIAGAVCGRLNGSGQGGVCVGQRAADGRGLASGGDPFHGVVEIFDRGIAGQRPGDECAAPGHRKSAAARLLSLPALALSGSRAISGTSSSDTRLGAAKGSPWTWSKCSS